MYLVKLTQIEIVFSETPLKVYKIVFKQVRF